MDEQVKLRGVSARRAARASQVGEVAGRRRSRSRSTRDNGYVLIITALLLLPLLAFTGFAIDLGTWAGTASKVQAASDAAALAGVVYLPDQTAKAISVAKETAKKNGYEDGVNGVTVTVTPNERNELDVLIFDPNVGQYFSSAFTDPPDISRGATAEFIRPVAMGSPSAALGQDPERGFNPAFVLNVAGRGAKKENGDKRSTGDCTNSNAGCTGGINSDYSTDGYLYSVDVGAGSAAGQPLKIEVYDPAYTYNGDTCTANNLTAAQINQLALNHPGDTYGTQRYQSGTSTWCMGDQNLAGSTVNTTYIVRAPDSTPSDLSDNPAVCAITFSPYDPGSANAMFTLLDSNATRGLENQVYRNHYRKWFPICTVPAGQVQQGSYVVQVRTNADLSSPLTSTTASLGGGRCRLAGERRQPVAQHRRVQPLHHAGGPGGQPHHRTDLSLHGGVVLGRGPPAHLHQPGLGHRRVLPGPHHSGDGGQDPPARLLGHGRRRQLHVPAVVTDRRHRIAVPVHVHPGRNGTSGRHDLGLHDGGHHQRQLQRPQRHRPHPHPRRLQLCRGEPHRLLDQGAGDLLREPGRHDHLVGVDDR